MGPRAEEKCPCLLRRTVVWDAENNREIELLSNQLNFGATPCRHLLLKWLHRLSKANWTLSNFASLRRLNLFTYRDPIQWLNQPLQTLRCSRPQLNLPFRSPDLDRCYSPTQPRPLPSTERPRPTRNFFQTGVSSSTLTLNSSDSYILSGPSESHGSQCLQRQGESCADGFLGVMA